MGRVGEHPVGADGVQAMGLDMLSLRYLLDIQIELLY